MKIRWSLSRSTEMYFLVSALFLASATGIRVDFGTNTGPIVPPPPSTPRPPPQQPYREPAPVWEDNVDDIPNPNPYKPAALPNLQHWLSGKGTTTHVPPSNYHPPTTVGPTQPSYVSPSKTHQGHTRYTQVLFNRPHPAPAPSTTLSPAKAFVNAYARPTTASPPTVSTHNYPTHAPQQHYRQEDNYQRLDNHNGLQSRHNDFTVQVPGLSVRYIPGFGFKYFTPEQDRFDPRKDYRYNTHNKYNSLDSNDIFGNHQHQNDIDLSYDKYMAQRVKKSPVAQTSIPQQTFAYYLQQPHLVFPAQWYPTH